MMAYGNALKSTTTDASELSKLTKSLTLEQTKNVLVSKSLNAETVKSVLCSRELTVAELQSVTATIAKSGATNTATFSVGAYTAALWANAKAMAASLLLNPVAWITGIAIAIGIVTKAYQKLNPTIEEQKEKLDELKSSYTSLQDEVDSLGTTIEENNKKIVALQEKMSNHTITLVEEDELNKLRIENELLQQQYDIKEDLANQKQKEVVEKSVKTFNNEFGTYKEPKETDELNIDTYKAFMTAYDNMDSQKFLLLVDENQRMLDEAIASQDTRMIESLTKDKELLDVALNEKLLSLTEYQNDLLPLMNENGTFDDSSNQDMWDEIEKWKRTLYERLNQPGDWNTIQIKAVIDKNPLLNIQSLLGQIDTLTAEDINKFFGLNSVLKDANLILTEGQSPASVFLQYLRSIADTQNSMATADTQKVFTFDEVLSGLEESYTTLEEVKEQWSDTGKVSVDSIQDIMSKFPGLTNLLSDYVQGKKDEQDIIDALSEEYATDLENYKLYVAQKNGDDEQFYANIVNNLSQDLINKAEYYGIELGKYKSYNEAKLAIDKEYELKKAKLQKTENAVHYGFEKMRKEGIDIDNPKVSDSISLAIYESYIQQQKELEEYEKFIKDFNTDITVDVPDFNLDLFKSSTGEDAKEFSESIDWAANSIANLEREISKLNDTISNTTDIDKKVEQLKKLKEKQQDLADLKGEAKKEYKKQYDNSLKQLTPAQRKKYKKLIESTTEVKPSDFEGKDKEELYNKIKNSQSLWQQYQQSVTDHDAAKQDVKDTDKAIKDTDVLERSKQEQEKLEKELDTVNEKLEDSSLTTKEKNDLLEKQYNLQKAINVELRKQAKHNKDKDAIKKLDAEDKNNEDNYNSSIYENNKEDTIRNVGINEDKIKGIQNKIDLNGGLGTKQDYDDMKILHQNNATYWEQQKIAAEAMRDEYDVGTEGWDKWNKEVQDCDDSIHSCNKGIKECQQSILDLPLKDVEQKIESINKQINSLNRDLDEQTELIDAATAIFDEEIEKQNLIKEGIQDKIDALQEEHDLREANLNVQKAAWELQKAKENRTTKVFREGVGFVFEADQEEVQNASQNYDNAIYERKIQLLNEEVKRVDDNIESLSKQKKQWEDIIPLMERSALITKAEAYDMQFKNKVLSSNVDLLKTIKDNYGDIYTKINALEETKKPYELLQEELTDISQTFSLGGISYDDALAQTKAAITQYYPELLAKYEKQGTSLDEVAKKQLEGVGVTEETSKKNTKEVKTTNDEITQSYKVLLKDLTDVFTELDDIMSAFAKKARDIATSVIGSVSAISSAISGTGSIVDGDFKIANAIPTQYQKLDDATLDMYNNISKNLNTSLVQGTKISTNTKPPITTTNNNKSTNITFGDIVVNDVKNAHDFAKTIASSLSSAMKQELYK